MTAQIDLNADLGEGMGTDAELFPLISSASIACGGHAGDRDSMIAALRGCRRHAVIAGAHPSFVDREHFGRRRLDQYPRDIARDVVVQIDALKALAEGEDVPVRYVKLHGALANMAAEDEGLAETVFGAIADRHPDLAILAMEGTAQESAAHAVGRVVVTEAYADRAYTADGLLVSREMPGAVIVDPDRVLQRCLRLTTQKEIVAIDGTIIPSQAQSICLHGDTSDAVVLARKITESLRQVASIVSPLR